MFLGHVNDVKQGSYTVLQQYQNKKILINSADEFKIVSNICPHQKSLISQCDGIGKRICPYHGWSFDLDGKHNVITNNQNTQRIENLYSETTFEWNSLLFSQPVESIYNVNFSYMVLGEQRVDNVNADYRNVVDLFLDVDHIALLHSGVYENIGLENITKVDWQYHTNDNLQTVARNSDRFLDHVIDEDKDHGGFWLTVFPNTMVEWQPGALFVTIAMGNNKVLVYKYKDSRYSNESYAINSYVWETAWNQDKSQAERLTEFCEINLCDAKKQYRAYLLKNQFE